MSREIKFRAWWKILNEIQYFDTIAFLELKDDVLIYQNQPDIEPHGIDEVSDGIVLMQYTGLKDKNGVEIYEGDVISVMDTFQAEIIYEAPSFKLRWIDEYQVKRNADNKTIAWNAHIIYEVIGNIYGNPELTTNSDTSKTQ